MPSRAGCCSQGPAALSTKRAQVLVPGWRSGNPLQQARAPALALSRLPRCGTLTVARGLGPGSKSSPQQPGSPRQPAPSAAAGGSAAPLRGRAPRGKPPQPQPLLAAEAAVVQSPADALKAAGEPPVGGGLASPKASGGLWALLVLSLAYLHHSTCGFALPALLPLVTDDLHLTDSQGALLTAGYTVLYAVALVPVGLLADRVNRPRLLAGGIALWSVLTIAASETQGFGQLLATRVGFAAAQATQNPICFSLIPELFPAGRTTAMAVYNIAIYAGRALSFAALTVASQLGVPPGVIGDIGNIGYTLVPLDKVDLSLVSILYTQGDFAAISPVYTYALDGEDGVPIASAYSAWRPLLRALGPPGLLMAMLCLLTVGEPREQAAKASRPKPTGGLLGRLGLGRRAGGAAISSSSNGGGAAAAALAAPAPAVPLGEIPGKLRELVSSPAFLSLTLAAALNDVGSWALVSWQATFYQRVYHLSPETYAPLLAVVIPIGGIIGGVGAGVFGDRLNRMGARGWITAGASMAGAPVIAASLLVPDYKQSFAALLVGFALSEAWRAPAAVMVRDVSPAGLGSTASAVHLCIRNLLGGFGPIAVALLSARVGLQLAMLLVPTCYLLSGLGFLVTEGVVAREKALTTKGSKQK